jgi:hypothetical protein
MLNSRLASGAVARVAQKVKEPPQTNNRNKTHPKQTTETKNTPKQTTETKNIHKQTTETKSTPNQTTDTKSTPQTNNINKTCLTNNQLICLSKNLDCLINKSGFVDHLIKHFFEQKPC